MILTGQEIIKQLYDIGNIFEEIDDVNVVNSVFSSFALVELQYRNMGEDINLVLDDIIENILSINDDEKNTRKKKTNKFFFYS
jgi:hypothetical protein